MIRRLALFGATGDLAGRFLLPAAAALVETGKLPRDFGLTGSGRDDLDDEAFRSHAAERLDEHAGQVDAKARDELLRRLRYRRADLADPSSVAQVLDSNEGPVAAYLALPPDLFETAIRSLCQAGLPEGSRVVVEKPFGDDLEHAEALNRALAELPGGHWATYRVDHVLGMATTQNLLGLRFANSVLEPLWNGERIESVELLWEETLALEGRAGYYDEAGALKDVVQNHLLHLFALVAMEPPAGLGSELRDAKLAALRSVIPLRPEQMSERTRRARYTAGVTNQSRVPAYVDEDGVDPGRETETFAEIGFELDGPRWAGTRFLLRGAKAMRRRRKGILLRFRIPSDTPFDEGRSGPANALWIGIDGPNEIRLELSGADAGPTLQPAPFELVGQPPASELPAYARVMYDVLSGGSMFSVGGDGAEEAWRLVTPVIEAWAAGRVPMLEYPAGSDGP